LIDRLRAWIERNGAGAAWVSDPVSIAYLTGFHADPHERLMGLAVGPSGPVLVVPALEQEGAERQTHGVEVVGWHDGSDPYLAAAGALGSVGRLAVEKHHLTLAVAERLQTVAHTDELVDVGPTIREFRRCKSPGELELLRRAAELTDRVAEAVLG